MKVRVEKIENHNEKESALLRVFKVDETITMVKQILEKYQTILIVQDINSGVKEKINIHEVIYFEYLERNVFLYTKKSSYSLRTSLTKFMEENCNVFIQIRKNIGLNVYFLQSFATTNGGNLIVIVSTGEKLIVSRRYVKALKESLSKLASKSRL